MMAVPAIAMPLGFGDALRACFRARGARVRFERACSEYFGACGAFAVSSGRAALWIALEALKKAFPKRDRVIVPAYACPSVGRAVMRAGLVGLCVDVQLADMNIDCDEVARFLDDRTLAVVALHMFGTPCDLGRLTRMCSAAGAALIEDLAQACGSTWEGRPAGSFGDMAFLSLGRSKNLRGYRGGVLLVNRGELAELVRREVEMLPPGVCLPPGALLKQLAISVLSWPLLWSMVRHIRFLRVGAEDPTFDPAPSLLPHWQAALGLTSLSRLEHYNARRRQLGMIMEEELAEAPGIQVQAKAPPRGSVYVRLATLLDRRGRERDAVQRALQAQGIDARAFYTNVIYRYDWWQAGSGQTPCPRAERVVESNLTLPIYYAMTAEEARGVAAALKKVIGV